jgi:integrase
MGEPIKLTKRAVDGVPLLAPSDKVKQQLYFDAELRGFGMRVGATAKTYFVQREVKGRSRRVTIGRHGVLTPDQARRKAVQLLAKMADGVDPAEEKRRARAKGFTLREALDLCEQTLRTEGSSPRTIDGYRYDVETYLGDWLDRALAEITRDEAHRRHRKIAEGVAAGKFAGEYSNGRKRARTSGHGKHTADRAMIAFRRVYNRALRAHPELPVSPTINVDFFRVKREKKELPLSRIHEWHAHVEAMDNPIRRDLLLFTLHTGLRRKNACEVRWEHVDFERRTLFIPDPKSKRPFYLPLTDYLARLLRARRKENAEAFEDSPWVFPAESESGHVAEPREDFEGIHWTPHDLRRWFITAAESLDLSPYVIKSLVNHSLPSRDVTASYIQHEVERLRPDMERIGARLRALCEQPKAARRKGKR